MKDLPLILPEPKLPENLNSNSKWLAGEGAGSWFSIIHLNEQFRVLRFSPYGKFECGGIFQSNDNFETQQYFEVTYPSNCREINILQQERRITLNLIEILKGKSRW